MCHNEPFKALIPIKEDEELKIGDTVFFTHPVTKLGYLGNIVHMYPVKNKNPHSMSGKFIINSAKTIYNQDIPMGRYIGVDRNNIVLRQVTVESNEYKASVKSEPKIQTTDCKAIVPWKPKIFDINKTPGMIENLVDTIIGKGSIKVEKKKESIKDNFDNTY